MITSLRNERAKLQQRIDEIEEVFGSVGTASGGGRVGGGGAVRRKPGRPPGSGNTRKSGGRGGRRKRGSFSISGEESVFQFVKSTGKPNAAEVNKHWQKEGRGGKADNTLTKLVKDGRLKRVQVKGERGGRYQAA
jgi:hypothetical protein